MDAVVDEPAVLDLAGPASLMVQPHFDNRPRTGDVDLDIGGAYLAVLRVDPIFLIPLVGRRHQAH